MTVIEADGSDGGDDVLVPVLVEGEPKVASEVVDGTVVVDWVEVKGF